MLKARGSWVHGHVLHPVQRFVRGKPFIVDIQTMLSQTCGSGALWDKKILGIKRRWEALDALRALTEGSYRNE